MVAWVVVVAVCVGVGGGGGFRLPQWQVIWSF